MKTKADLKVKPFKKPAFSIDTPEDYFKMNHVIVYSGKKQGGKTNACMYYVMKLLKEKIIDDYIVCSATYQSNKEMFQFPHETNVVDPLDKTAIDQVIEIITQAKEEYEEYLQKLKRYNEFKKDIARRSVSLEDIFMTYGMEVYEFMEEKPKCKYHRVPRFYVIFDDILGTPLMSSSTRGLTNFIIKHRHIADGTGCSVAILTQSYSSQNGLNRVIRENTNVLCLFSNTDDAQLEKIYDENINPREITIEQFKNLFETATNEPFAFLTIDFSAKDKAKKFRKSFHEYITI